MGDRMDNDNGDITTSELMNYIRSAFRPRHFAEVEQVLTAKENKYNREIDRLVMELALMEERHDFLRLDNLAVVEKLKERARKAESEADLWKKNFDKLEDRVSRLEEDIVMLISPVTPSMKVAGGCVEKKENGTGITNFTNLKVGEDVVECDDNIRGSSSLGDDCPFPAKAKGEKQCGGNVKRAIGDTILNIDCKDNCESSGNSSVKIMTCEKPSDLAHADETGVVTGSEKFKRKRDSHVSNFDRGCDDGDAKSGKCKMKKPQVAIHERNCSPDQNCFTMPVSSDGKFTPSRLVEQILKNNSSEFGGINIIDSSSSSDTDDDTDSESSPGQSMSKLKSKGTWECEANFLCDVYTDYELCMKSVCALYRQREFKQFDVVRGTTLAKFLIDGDPEGKLKKSVEELQKYDPRGPENCRGLAMTYTGQLFDMYKKKVDPFFPTC